MANDEKNNKINDAIKKVAEEKEKIFKKDPLPLPLTGAPAVSVTTTRATSPEKTMPSEIDQKIIVYHNPKHPIAEQFRALFTYINSLDISNNLKTIVITSSSHQEGKSISAVNLGVIIAQDVKKRVLIIDCNLRNPSVDSLLGMHSQKGLYDILTSSAQTNDMLKVSSIKNLTVLPAGHITSTPTELLGSHKMKDMLAELKTQFDYILLDTPAVIPYADPCILAPLADGVIIVTLAGRTRREVVVRAEAILKNVNAKVLGYVLTGIRYYIPEYIHRHL